MEQRKFGLAMATLTVMFGAVGAVDAACDRAGVGETSSARFIVKGDEVYDTRTALTWMRCSVGQRWDEQAGCAGVPKKLMPDRVAKGWAGSWRMPTVHELESIVAGNCRHPAVDEDIFPGTLSEWYQGSREGERGCWGVDFSAGRVTYYAGHGYCEYGHPVRLVRTGQ
jgi:hypothetical protein